jgi:hypothetical protein
MQWGVKAAIWVALAALSGPAQAQSPAPCDRSCLADVLDRYLAATLKHDPAAGGLAPGHRATENAVDVPAGQGVWRTATALGVVQRRYFDPVAGQAAYFGHLREGEMDSVVSLRIKVAGRAVAEAEWTIARKAATGMFDAAGLAQYPPPPEGPLPARERTPRFQMMSIANGYFQALQDHDGEGIPHVDRCERVENGVKVTHRPRPAGPPGAPPAAAAPGLAQEEISGDCVAGFEGFRNSIAETTLRRFPLIDEEAGVVMGMTIFRRPPANAMRRNLLTEFFYVRGGKLAGIWAAMYYLPPEVPHGSGWD